LDSSEGEEEELAEDQIDDTDAPESDSSEHEQELMNE